MSPTTGKIVHAQHPQRGASLAGKVLVLLEARGSGTNAQVLAEAWANGVGPAAVVLGRPDSVLNTGVVVARELYGVQCPVAVADEATLNALRHARRAAVWVQGSGATLTYDQYRRMGGS